MSSYFWSAPPCFESTFMFMTLPDFGARMVVPCVRMKSIASLKCV